MSKEDRRAGWCNFSPGPMTCLSCPFPECTNNRPPVRGEDGVEKYVNLTDGTKENVMKTKYAVGDTVKVGAKIEKIEIDEKGVKYILSSGYWRGLKEVREGELSSGSSKSTPKTSAKTEKTSAKTEKASKAAEKRQKTAENGKEKQQGSTEGPKAAKRQQDTAGGRKLPANSGEEAKAANRQQAVKRPGRAGKKAATNTALSALARELADSV